MTAAIDARTGMGQGQPARVRAALDRRWRQGALAVSAARRRLRRPALTVCGLGCIDVAAFHGGQVAGWLITGISVFVFEACGGEDE